MLVGTETQRMEETRVGVGVGERSDMHHLSVSLGRPTPPPFLWQAMKVLSKKRLMRQAGFPRKSGADGLQTEHPLLLCSNHSPSFVLLREAASSWS